MSGTTFPADHNAALTIVAFRHGQPPLVVNVGRAAPALDRRVHHALPPAVLEATRGLAHDGGISPSRVALALQMAGLAWIAARVGWPALYGWRRPHGNPRAPYDLGMPQPWLDALAGDPPLEGTADLLFRQDVSPIAYPATRRTLYSQPDAWHWLVQTAARSLQVPAGHLLGLLQIAGLLAHRLSLPPTRGVVSPAGWADRLPEWVGRGYLMLLYAMSGQHELARWTAGALIGERSD